jgi:hypothetical protein
LLGEQTLGLLAVRLVKVIGILAWVSVPIFKATRQRQHGHDQCNDFHMPSFSKNASMIRLAMSGGKNASNLKPTQMKAR